MLFIDAQNAGISGDMFIAALLDMGTSVKRIEEALTPISGAIGEFKIRTKKVKRGPFEATSYGFDFEKLKITYSEAKAAIKNAGLSEGARDFAISCFETLTDAESKVHGVKKEELHLHDVADTIGDFVAAAACLNELGLLGTKVLSSPVNTGKGFFTFHKKRSTLPAPSTAKILKGKPIFGDVDFELTTPTGAAILVNLAEDFVDEFPQMRIEKIGYGAGKNDLDFPNVLKLYVGGEADFGLIRESLDLLETNVDTASGEVLGYLFEELLEEGALDVVVVPCTMKKNRPGHIVKVLCKSEDSARLSRIVMKETGSLGVRIMPSVHRYVLKRTIVKKKVRIDKKDFTVRFKVASDAKEDVISERPEFEDVKKIATETGLSLREVERLLRG